MNTLSLVYLIEGSSSSIKCKRAAPIGSMPLNVLPAPAGDKAVVVLSGWREQGIQVVDLKTRQVAQTLTQDGAFYEIDRIPRGIEMNAGQ